MAGDSLQRHNMSHTSFEEIFDAFRVKFPPVDSADDAVLKLTTEDVSKMITDFWPDVEWPRTGITRFLMDQGYRYTPIEYNDRVRYFWLVGRSES